MSERRAYSSEIRERAKADTRDAIIRAVITVILREGVHAFTMQNVAARAGVSLRTVYRHFASREQLLEGLSDHLEKAASAGGFSPPTDVKEMPEVAPELYRRFDPMRDAVSAYVVASIATGYRPKSHVERLRDLSQTLAAAYPNLTAEKLREASAVIGVLMGSRMWYVLTGEMGLGPEQGGRAAEWGLRTLLDDLERRNAAAKPTKNTGGAYGTPVCDA